MTTMSAMTIVSPRRAELREVPRPEPQPHQVRVRVLGCGVCASNLGPWCGLPWLDYPLEPGQGGHEGWGVVEKVGRRVQGLQEGARIAFLSERAWAEYDLVDEGSWVELPSALQERAFPGEPFGCGVNIFERSRIRPGDRVAVIGLGFLGAIVTRLAAAAGAEVIAISRRESSRALGEEMGASHTLPMEHHHEILEAVGELTEGRGCDRVVECVGLQWPLDLAAELCGTRATLVVAGYHQDGPRQVDMQQWNWKGLDVINAHEREPAAYVAGIERAVQLVLDGVLDPERLLTHAYGLTRLDRALDATHDKPDGFVKAVVTP